MSVPHPTSRKSVFSLRLSLRGFVGATFAFALVAGLFTLPARGQDDEESPPVLDYSQDCTTAGCHDEFNEMSSLHDPVASGDCDSCHDEIDPEAHTWQLNLELEELCLGCHEDFAEDYKFAHGPVAAGACFTCHDQHGSNRDQHLIADPTTLCLGCHTTIQDLMGSATHTHDPATDDCVSCHDPHGADNRMNLLMEPPELCLDCHDEIADAQLEATVTHDAMTAEGSCVNCHSPHASDYSHVLRLQPMDLCLDCHAEPVQAGDTTLAGLQTLLTEKTNHHGPIQDKECTSCHSGVHGGNQFRLLLAAYPETFYAQFDESLYALCFECHEPDLVLEDRTDALTNFRNGDQNLHFLHVNRQDKGRTCRACHNTHASDNPFHITESVPFGKSNWKLPLNYERSDTGGSCMPGCHKSYSYDREAAVVNISD